MDGIVRLSEKCYRELKAVLLSVSSVPSPQLARSMSQSQTKIDDQDLPLVKYNGTWIRGGSSNEFDGTVASSTHVGDSFTVSFFG